MFKPRIIIAEKNPVVRSRIARALTDRTLPLQHTNSAADLLQDLLRNGAAIVVLGELEEGLPVTTLIRLLKNCSPQLSIILINDDLSPVEERMVRTQGVFYHANQPVETMGWNELRMAVTCASKKAIAPMVSCSSH